MLRSKPGEGTIRLYHLEAGLLGCRTEAVVEIREDQKLCLRNTLHKPHSTPLLLCGLDFLPKPAQPQLMQGQTL